MKHPSRPTFFFKILVFFAAATVLLVAEAFFAFAGEFDNPPKEWIFYSDWEHTLGTSREAIQDGNRWNDYYPEPKHNEDEWIGVVDNPPPGGPGGNALKIRWEVYHGGDCSDGQNGFVELFPSLPNPFYARIYFYSEYPTEYPGCGGRKFMYFKNSDGYYVGGALYLYSGPGEDVRIHIKNGVYENNHYNTPTAEHLDGRYPWPGKESEGIVKANRWHCIEFAHYRHNTDGWLKAWLDGKLVINASKEAWRVDSYDTDVGRDTNWLQIPSYRNGGIHKAHNEYFDNFVISSSYIGPLSDRPNPPPSNQVNITGLSPPYSQIGKVSVGETVYVDRTYTLLSGYSSEYEGLPLIKTACDDKDNSANEYLSFTVDKHVTLYVCFEQATPPMWLSTNFVKTNDTIARTGRTYDIWAKKFPPGRIALGGSSAQGAGDIHDTYFVLVEKIPSPPTGLTLVLR
jgi:hypothetical protein